MNDLILGCYGDLTLNKLNVFFPGERSHLQGWGDPEHIIAGLPYRQDSISEQADFEETKLQTIRERLRNAHLAAGWDIWLRFGSFLTHTKRKNQPGFGLILLALHFLSPCWLEAECERRQSDLLTEQCRMLFSIF